MPDREGVQQYDRRQRRRLLVRTLSRALVTVVLLSVAYFALPMDRLDDAGAVTILVGGLAAVVALCIWQVMRIIRSPTPMLRAAEALAVTLPTYLLGSATTTFLLSTMDPTSFTEPLTRLDALYFTLTVFATVGFGDIAPVDQTARGVVTTMMVGNLVMLAVGVKVLTNAAKWGRDHRRDDTPGESE